MYTIRKCEYSSRTFRDLFIVYDYADREVATIQKNPFSPVIDQRMTIVKFSNELLYRKDWCSHCASILRDLDIEFKGISRIDICADFDCFSKGKHPQTFIRELVACKLLHNGRSKMHFVATQAQQMIYETLKIGSMSSDVDVKLYNKTKEMQDVKTKPHITEKWRANGWDGESEMWRLEFSMKSNAIKILVADTAELRDIDARFLQYDGNVIMLYKLLYDKYFDIRVNDGQKNKSRMQRASLLDLNRASAMLFRNKIKEPTNKADKIFIKKLHMLDVDIREFPLSVLEARDLLEAYFVHTKDLNVFYESKILPLQKVK